MLSVDLDAPEHAICSSALKHATAANDELSQHLRYARERADKAEAELATARKLLLRFVEALGRTTMKELDSFQDEDACVELLEAYLEGRRSTSPTKVDP